MKRITVDEFYAMIEKNPSVFEHWDTPLEIIEYVDCKNHSNITHLSPHLTFSGNNENGDVANFKGCPNLKIATGIFNGGIWFANSGIQKIEALTVTQPDNNGWAATFALCENLQIASGNYAGTVLFSGCGIHSIQNLHIHTPNADGEYAAFQDCPNLKTLEGWDLSKKIQIDPEKLAAEKERRAIQKFHRKTQPEELPFL
jgi:hypothetical protein